jgi:ribosomal-protein-alanine N-acetyltransferase
MMRSIYDFSSFPILTTQRLQLRQLKHEDAEVMMKLFSSPEVLRFLDMEPTDSLEKARGLIDWLAGNYENRKGIDWGITLHQSGQLIGMCGAYDWDRVHRHIDLGYHILPEYWGRGYATEASHAIIGWCFDALDLHRIQADCTEGNIASERVMLKCGFRYEGLWRESCWEHGRFVNIKQFGLLRSEYSPA